MRHYDHEAREEMKYCSSQDHGPTVVPVTECGELCNYDLFIFSIGYVAKSSDFLLYTRISQVAENK